MDANEDMEYEPATRFTGLEPWDAECDPERGVKYFEAPFVLALGVFPTPGALYVGAVTADATWTYRIKFLLHHNKREAGAALTFGQVDIFVAGLDLRNRLNCGRVAHEFTLRANMILHRSKATKRVNFLKRFEKIHLEKWEWCQHFRDKSEDDFPDYR